MAGTGLQQARTTWPSFDDVALEARYLRHNQALARRSRAWLAMACGIALLLLLWAHDIALSAGGLTAYSLAVLVPMLAWIGMQSKSLERVATMVSVVVVATLPLVTLDFPTDTLLFVSLQITVLIYIAFTISASYRVRMLTLFAMLVLWGAVGFPKLAADGWPLDPLVVIGAILLSAIAGSVDYQHRRRFAAVVRQKAQTAEARANQVDRLEWLENMARFLRHELRNALLGISTSLDIMRRKGLAQDGEQYVERAARAAFNMKRLLDDSAEATALEQSLAQDHPEMIDLADWLTDRVELYQQQYDDAEIKLKIDSSVRIAATEERLGQLLDKLVNNAVEHADEGTPIELRLGREPDFAVLEVANRGDVLPGDKESIFRLFASGKESGGTNIGLGLHIVRLIVEAYGGSVRAVDLNDPPGACFEVRWPIGFFTKSNRSGRGGTVNGIH